MSRAHALNMMPVDDYRAIKQRAARRLLKIPGINAVGLGGRVVGGRPTGEVAIKVFVTRKKPSSEVPPEQLVPASIEGVPTDVAELGPVRRATAVPGVMHPGGMLADIDDHRPLRGGISMSAEGQQGLGTLGCLLIDLADSSAVYALTNHHVVTVKGKLSRSRQVAHPSTASLNFEQASSFGIVADGVMDATRDAAIVRLSTGEQWLPFIEDVGWVRGTHDVTIDDIRTHQYQVRKRGSKTRITGGIIVSLDTETDIEGSITKGNVIIAPNPDPTDPNEKPFFSFEGDSGSVVVNESNEIVALFYATDEPSGQGIATPIGRVLRAFKDHAHVELAVAVPKNAAPTPQNELRTVDPPAGSPRIGGPEEIARGDHTVYRPLTGGAQILASPMLGPVNSTTLGCIVTEVANPQKAYMLTSYVGLSANGNIPPTGDTDIGQPDNEGRSSGCCRNTVGAFFKGGPPDQTPTAGLVTLKGDLAWVPEILRIGVVADVRTLDAAEVNGEIVRVRKCGAGSGLTGGTVVALGGVAGTLPSGVAGDAMVIRPNPNRAKPGEPIFFSTFNDRGAVVVDDGNRVLGVIYDEVDIPDAQGNHVFHGVATPIAIVLEQLRAHAGVEVEVATSDQIDDVRTTSARELAAERTPAFAPPPLEEQRLPSHLRAAWLDHQQEIRTLIDRNRKVAAVWRRAGGPALVQAFLRAWRAPSDALPVAVNGMPMAACLERIGAVLTKYGSAALGADLAQLRARVPYVGGLSLDEIFDAIRSGAADA